MYISEVKQRWLVRGLVASGLSLGVAGLVVAIANPKIANYQKLASIHEAGSQREAVAVGRDALSTYGGLSLTAVGIGSLLLASMLSEPLPKRLPLPDPEAPEDTQVRPEESLLDQVRRAIAEIYTHHPFVQQLVGGLPNPKSKGTGTVCVTTGPSGSGKSAFASAIALFRTFAGHEVVVLDPHAAENKRFGTWLTGRILDADAIKAELPALLKSRDLAKGDRPLTLVIDELSGWEEYDLLAEAQTLIDHGLRNARKAEHHLIYLSHGLEKGLFGGEDNKSGVVDRLLSAATIIDISCTKDDWGQTQWTGHARFKPGNRDPKQAANWSNTQIPKLFDPDSLRQQFCKLFDSLSLSPVYSFERAIAIHPEIEKRIGELLNPESEQFLSALENLYANSPDEPREPLDKPLQAIVDKAKRDGRFISASQVKTGCNAWKSASTASIREAFLALADDGYGVTRGDGETLEFKAY